MKHNAQPNHFERVIRWHLTRFPRLETRDLVKILYQAAFGNYHLGTDLEEIRKHMERELASRSKDRDSVYLIEPLSADMETGWVRVNLDTWQRAGGDIERLVDVVAASAGGRQDGRAMFGFLLRDLKAFLQKEAMAVPGETISFWTKWMQENSFSPVHHSTAYVQAYHPAYRVVYFPLLCRCLPLRATGKVPNPGGLK